VRPRWSSWRRAGVNDFVPLEATDTFVLAMADATAAEAGARAD
jgi:hypothetical protein